MKNSLKTIIAAACALLLQTHGYGQDYHPNDVTPAGTPAGRLSGTSGGRQVGGAQTPNGYPHAVLINGNALAFTDLNPVNAYYSMAMCSDDVQQGGWGYLPAGIHALVWSGSSASCADLNPSGYSFSYCLGVHNGEQVGYAQNQVYAITASHAMCWHGSAASVVDLHPVAVPVFGMPLPVSYPFSRALGCHNGEEVGYVSTIAYPDGDYAGGYHTTSIAMRWNGTAASVVSLHPPGFYASEATCTDGTQQGGWGYNGFNLTSPQHALLWSGTADSVVDLHPASYTDSKVTALSGTNQVGEGWIGAANAVGSIRHALLWSGTTDSVVDLNQYLPAGYTNAVATGIDTNGSVVGFAYNGTAYGLNIPAGAIAVVFAPGAQPPTQLASISLSSANVVPGDVVQAQVSLVGAAPAGGVSISFLSTDATLVATPASLTIPEGESNAVFTVITGGATLTVPASLKIYASDGTVSRFAPLTLTPVVKLASLVANPVEGGFATYGSVSLNIPGQIGGATVLLTSGNTSLVAVPASVFLYQGYTAMSFSVNTAPVTVSTIVPVTATFNGTTVSGSLTLSPAPVVSLANLSAPETVGGQTVWVSVSLNNFPRAAAGAVITLTSGDTGTLQVPATVTVPYGTYSVTVPATSVIVNGRKGVSLKATYNGGQLTTTVFVLPIPVVTMTQADYMLDTKMLKIQATTTFTNSILTYGNSVTGPFGTMQLELGVFKGSIFMDIPPTNVTVWSSVGGQASMPVTVRTGLSGGGTSTGGGGGGGGGSTVTTYKLTLSTNGRGSVTASPSAASYAPGTVVTLTATPVAGQPWIGWSGAITGTKNPATVTINANTSVTANFR